MGLVYYIVLALRSHSLQDFGVCDKMVASVIRKTLHPCGCSSMVLTHNNFRIFWLVTCRLYTLLERSFLCNSLHLWSYISNATIHDFLSKRAVQCHGFYFCVRNVEAYIFHSTTIYPFRNAWRTIRCWSNTVEDKVPDVLAGTSCLSPLHKCG